MGYFKQASAAVGLALWLVSSAQAGEAVLVKAYHPDGEGRVLAYDDAGKRIGKIPVGTLPKPEFEAAGYDARSRRVKVHAADGDVWLLAIQVETSVRVHDKTDCDLIKNMSLKQAGKSSSDGAPRIVRGLGDGGCR
ncbi:hypothetical protein [Oleispirillum naphthae]|uniref:hypothetical protein n=1 Tax=Oleispirillum naphthae TaxID=2838853 RepID=UPI0030824E9C